jgi:hypothetical protein
MRRPRVSVGNKGLLISAAGHLPKNYGQRRCFTGVVSGGLQGANNCILLDRTGDYTCCEKRETAYQ